MTFVKTENIFTTNKVAREFAIIKQGLDKRPKITGAQDILDAFKKIKLLQLDTINAVERSHYLVLLSRLGVYDKANLDDLYAHTYLVEQKCHEACLIQAKDYLFLQPLLQERRKKTIPNIKLKQLGADPDAVFKQVMEAVKNHGAMASKDFADTRSNDHKEWWNRKPERVALDILYKRGYLAVQRNKNFHCYYDLPERIIPAQYLNSDKSLDEFMRWAILNSLDAQGIATATDISDYYRQKVTETRPVLNRLIEEGSIARVDVEGWEHGAYVLTKDINTVNKLMDFAAPAEVSCLLSPFDNLIWNRERMERLFGLHFRVGIFVPKAERSGGYYSMPILHRGEIIGIADPKVDRKKKWLMINSINLTNKVKLDDQVTLGISKALKELARFTDCDTIEITKTTPNGLKHELDLLVK